MILRLSIQYWENKWSKKPLESSTICRTFKLAGLRCFDPDELSGESLEGICFHLILDFYFFVSFERFINTSNSSGKVDISGHDGDSISMDGTKVCIFKKSNKPSFRSFLESKDRWVWEFNLGVSGNNFSDQYLERNFSKEKFRIMTLTFTVTDEFLRVLLII